MLNFRRDTRRFIMRESVCQMESIMDFRDALPKLCLPAAGERAVNVKFMEIDRAG